MKKNNKSILILVTLILLLGVFIINIDSVINNIIDYSLMFLTKLFPVSFILYVISFMLIECGLIQFLNKYLHIKSIGVIVFILSFLSGFPSGVKYSKLLLDKKLINENDSNKIIMFTHFPNILFVLGTVNSVIGDKTITYFILISIFLSNFIMLLNYKSSSFRYVNEINNNNFSIVLNNSINSAFNMMFLIYGTSLFFYLISSTLFNIFNSNLYLYVFINGLFDLTNGVISSNLINNILFKSLFILIFLSFGSISIHMQVNQIIDDNYNYYFKGRVIGTLLSIFIFLILFYTRKRLFLVF